MYHNCFNSLPHRRPHENHRCMHGTIRENQQRWQNLTPVHFKPDEGLILAFVSLTNKVSSKCLNIIVSYIYF